MTQRRWPSPPWFWSVNDLSELTAGPLAPGSFGVHAFSVQSAVDGVEGLTLYVTYIVLGPNPNENPPEVHQLVYQGAFRAWRDSNLSVQVDPPGPAEAPPGIGCALAQDHANEITRLRKSTD